LISQLCLNLEMDLREWKKRERKWNWVFWINRKI